jgi:DNA-binding response OmpR family regulator
LKILVVEDEQSLSQSIVDYLTMQHYVCEVAMTYQEALYKIESFNYDCVVLDIMLPDGHGLQLLKYMKEEKKADGVIILSARNELDDKLTGLQMGADDYLTKPFHLAELGMRIAAVIRRRNFGGNKDIVFEEISINVDAKTARVGETELQLTQKEFDLLIYFVINKGRVLSKNTIAEHLWGDDMDMVDSHNFIYTHIKNLRRKLQLAGADNYIKSLYGMGYKFSIS